MPTFRKVEIVDARKFEDTNGSDLVFWVLSNGGRATHVQDDFGQRIRVYEHRTSHTSTPAFPGDWIEHRQDGSFEVTRQQVIDTYEEV
ncbi:hypothetical protein SEA_NIGHTMARE_67 [Arthrobacter phage Nightmare]|uniref:Uncharacterized protein n=1 Tax=Arthrobacter phage Nightmare TaxID=2015864 RepID=A0A221J6L5_9CAUD|nr:hypothetical protein QCN33_gp67 [Arthrobacter phage Nightmare]ASM62343.1 hypothetical protein SEA_NIGHTMARE_67 [Arthrobacter phage Nightmare]